MFVEELERINESEDKAEELQKKAKVDAKLILEDARTKARQRLEAAEASAKSTYDQLVREGQLKAEEQYKSFLEQTREDSTEMIKHARDNEKKAIELITERIVKISVNN